MESLHVSTDTTGAENFAGRSSRSSLVMAVAIISALALTGGLFAGYMFLKNRHAEQVNARRQAEMALANKTAARPAAPPEVQVFVDDAMLKGSQTLVGGTLINISRETLSDLSVELELRERKGGNLLTRSIPLEPQDLAPNQQGRYALRVASKDYSSARLLRIKSGSRPDEVPFKSVPGAQRPPEIIKPEVKTIIVKPPSKRSNGEEFINTPETPSKIN